MSKSSSTSTSNILQQEQNKIAVEKVDTDMDDPCRIIAYTGDSINKSDNHNNSNVILLDTDMILCPTIIHRKKHTATAALSSSSISLILSYNNYIIFATSNGVLTKIDISSRISTNSNMLHENIKDILIWQKTPSMYKSEMHNPYPTWWEEEDDNNHESKQTSSSSSDIVLFQLLNKYHTTTTNNNYNVDSNNDDDIPILFAGLDKLSIISSRTGRIVSTSQIYPQSSITRPIVLTIPNNDNYNQEDIHYNNHNYYYHHYHYHYHSHYYLVLILSTDGIWGYKINIINDDNQIYYDYTLKSILISFLVIAWITFSWRVKVQDNSDKRSTEF